MLSSRSLKAVVLGSLVLIGGCDRQSADKAQPAAAAAPAKPADPAAGTVDRSRKGSQLPDFTLTDPAGKELKLASLKGTPLLVNLWATWCAPCVAELPALDQLAVSRAGTLKVLTVSQDMGKPEAVPEFLKARGVARLEPWLDPNGDLAMHYGVQTLPTTIYYDAAGREVWRMVGAHAWTDAEADKLLAEAGS